MSKKVEKMNPEVMENEAVEVEEVKEGFFDKAKAFSAKHGKKVKTVSKAVGLGALAVLAGYVGGKASNRDEADYDADVPYDDSEDVTEI